MVSFVAKSNSVALNGQQKDKMLFSNIKVKSYLFSLSRIDMEIIKQTSSGAFEFAETSFESMDYLYETAYNNQAAKKEIGSVKKYFNG